MKHYVSRETFFDMAFTNYKAGFKTSLGLNFNSEFEYAHRSYPPRSGGNSTWTTNVTDFDTTLQLTRHGIDIGPYFLGLASNQQMEVFTFPSGYKLFVENYAGVAARVGVKAPTGTDYELLISISVISSFFNYPVHCYVFAVEKTDTHQLSMGAILSGRPYNNTNIYYSFNVCTYSEDTINTAIDTFFRNVLNEAYVDSYDPMSTADETTDGEGGYGNFDYSSDNDDFPDLPTVSVTSSGFVNMFKMNASGSASLGDLADYLWSGLFDIDTYLRLFQNPMECILSVGIVPIDPSVTVPLYIIVGNHATTLQAPRVVSQWHELDCGSVTVSGLTYSNSFMDYSPYTKAELYLPYVGTVALNIDEIMDSTVHVKYHIDLLSGSCVAYVKVSKAYKYKGEEHTHTNVLYQYSGNVLTNIPITSQNFTQILQAVIGAVATGVGASAASTATAGALGQESTQIAANAINVAESMKPSVSRSGNCSSACGLLGTQQPKLMLTLPKICYAEDMNKERGYPTYMRKTLSSLVGSGFTKIDLAHLKNIPCTDAERTEILALLESGVEL